MITLTFQQHLFSNLVKNGVGWGGRTGGPARRKLGQCSGKIGWSLEIRKWLWGLREERLKRHQWADSFGSQGTRSVISDLVLSIYWCYSQNGECEIRRPWYTPVARCILKCPWWKLWSCSIELDTNSPSMPWDSFTIANHHENVVVFLCHGLDPFFFFFFSLALGTGRASAEAVGVVLVHIFWESPGPSFSLSSGIP